MRQREPERGSAGAAEREWVGRRVSAAAGQRQRDSGSAGECDSAPALPRETDRDVDVLHAVREGRVVIAGVDRARIHSAVNAVADG